MCGVREYSAAGPKFWFRLCHMGNEDLLDLFVRQNAPFKIRIFNVHNSSL
jgi:hypothetical protein